MLERQDRMPGAKLIHFIEEYGKRTKKLESGQKVKDVFDRNFLKQLEKIHISDVWQQRLEQQLQDDAGVEQLNWSNLGDIYNHGSKEIAGHYHGEFKDDPRAAIKLISTDILCVPFLQQTVFSLFDPEEDLTPATEYLDIIVGKCGGMNAVLERGVGLLLSDVIDGGKRSARQQALAGDKQLLTEFESLIRQVFGAIKISKKWTLQAKNLHVVDDPVFAGDVDEVGHMLNVIARDLVYALRGDTWFGNEDRGHHSHADAYHVISNTKDMLHDLLATGYPEFILIQPQK